MMAAAAQLDTIDIIDASASPSLAKMFRRIGDLTTMPDAARRVMQLVSDQSSTAADLLDVVEGDPVLAAKVLRRVNSAFYGLRNKVTDLRSAISLLGFREIRNLALTVYMTRMIEEGPSYRNYSRQGLWDHCVAVAQASRLVANACRRESPDDAYLAGLLHDLGLILMDRFLAKYLLQVVDRVDAGASTCDAEMELLPFDHTQLGAYVAQQWNFPPQVIAAARYHHDPLTSPESYRDISCVVALGNYLCHQAGVASLGIANCAAPGDDVLEQIDLAPDQLSSTWERLQSALETAPSM